MSAPNHMEEPWGHDSNHSVIYGRGKRYSSQSEVPEGYAPNDWNEICYLKRKFDYIKRDYALDNADANARRIVACVNACAGIETETLERLSHCGVLTPLHHMLMQERDEAIADADALLYAAERAYETLIQERNNVPFKSRPYSTDETIELLRSAIAKARGIS